MRFFNVKLYRLFLLLCLIAVLWFGGNYYYESVQKESITVSSTETKQVYASG